EALVRICAGGGQRLIVPTATLLLQQTCNELLPAIEAVLAGKRFVCSRCAPMGMRAVLHSDPLALRSVFWRFCIKLVRRIAQQHDRRRSTSYRNSRAPPGTVPRTGLLVRRTMRLQSRSDSPPGDLLSCFGLDSSSGWPARAFSRAPLRP